MSFRHHCDGFADERFARVVQAFRENLFAGEEIGAALAVCLDQELVVDIWGGSADKLGTRPWLKDSLVNIWSTGKGVLALAIAALVSKGDLSYDVRVAEIWPEFGAGQKDQITVGQLLAHQAGLCGPDWPVTVSTLYDWELMVSGLALQTPIWQPTTAYGYHRLTFGHLAGEIIRRATGLPLDRAIQMIFRGRGGHDIYFGLPVTEEGRVVELSGSALGDAELPPPPPDPAWFAKANPRLDPEIANERDWRAALVPGANAQSNARAVALIYSALASVSSFNDAALVNSETLGRLSAVWSKGWDVVLRRESTVGAGVFINSTGLFGPNPKSFGHDGWGGSFGFYDPEYRMSVSYVMNRMLPEDASSRRARRLLDAVYASVALAR